MAITKATGSVIKDGEITDAKLAAGAAASADNVSLLGFKVASADSLAIFNMKDGIIDDYQDATGVDASTSTGETRNADNYYSGQAETENFSAHTSSGTWTCPAGVTSAEVLAVAGGGGGGGSDTNGETGGGGGAGGVIHHPTYTTVPAVIYDITVGSGGNAGGNPSTEGTNGGDSIFNVNSEGSGAAMTAMGGGAGGKNQGSAGGSGAGGGRSNNPGGAVSQTDNGGGTGYGNIGGISYSGNPTGAAGGGGASVGGLAGTDGTGGAGGAGKLFSNFTAYGVSGYFAGGGGGGGGTTGGAGGSGGGGAGGYDGSNVGAGTANTGGGGGGMGDAGNAGAGGTGVVLIRYLTLGSVTDMSLVSNAQTAQAAPSNSRVCMLMDPATGTTTINTDIKAWVSRDNGANYTQATLTDEGTYSGTQKILAGTADVSGQPSGTSMRYKIETLNQSGSKITRIYGTSLSWL